MPGRTGGDYDKAIADYTRGHPARPEVREAVLWRRGAYAWYRDKGDYDKAIADYTEAIRLDPEDTPAPTAAAATPGATRRTTTRPSPTTPRPSGSTRRTRSAYETAALPGEQEGVRQGHRRLYRGHPARPEGRIAVHQPRHRLDRQEGLRQGHRRLHRGHPARPEDAPAYLTAATPGPEEGVRQGHRRLQRGHPARPGVAFGLRTAAAQSFAVDRIGESGRRRAEVFSSWKGGGENIPQYAVLVGLLRIAPGRQGGGGQAVPRRSGGQVRHGGLACTR